MASTMHHETSATSGTSPVPLTATTSSSTDNSGALSNFSSSSEADNGVDVLTPATEASFGFPRRFSTSRSYAAVVVGAGPAGITVVSELVEQQRLPILWVDPQFKVGRMGTSYREVPSNTRVKVLLETANATKTNQNIIKQSKVPNAVTILEEMDQIKGCDLSYAVDMLHMFQEEFLDMKVVEQCYGNVSAASWSDESQWSIALDGESGPTVSSQILVLCTGSQPREVTSSLPKTPVETIHLDTALSPTRLASYLPSAPTTIGVMGTSHSAILVLMNLCNLISKHDAPVFVKWFVRHELRYAEHKEGWTLRDNTGLKGLAADFAKDNLEDSQLHLHKSWLERVDLPSDEAGEYKAYERELPNCTHLVQAVGYVPNQLPRITSNGADVEPAFNNLTGEFTDKKAGGPIHSLYGAGIAFPELVTDPLGNKEMNVGIWKFVKFLKRVSPVWK